MESWAVAHLSCAFAVALLVNSLAHDSLHGNVSKYRGVNAAVGWVCSFLAGLPRPVHARAHGLHHSKPMQPGDPHLWMHGGPRLLLPLRWLTGNLGYYQVVAGMPLRQLPAVALGVGAYLGLVLSDLEHTLISWVLPMQASTFMFALFTDWLPHGPVGQRVEADEQEGLGPRRRFHFATMWHQDHHRRPWLPFYQGPENLEGRQV